MKNHLNRLIRLASFVVLPLFLVFAYLTSFALPLDFSVTLNKKSSASNELNGDIVYHVLVAEFAGRANDLPTAVEHYLTIAEQSQNVQLAKRATRVSLYANNLDAAEKAAILWKSIDDSDYEVHIILATIYLQANHPSKLAKAIKRMLTTTKNTENEMIFYRLLPQLVETEQELKMIDEILTELAEDHKDSAIVKLTQAHLALYNAEYPKARSLIEPVILIKPELEEALLLKAKILHAQNEVEAAITWLDYALTVQPKSIGLQNLLAKMHLVNKDFEQAGIIYRGILMLRPTNQEALTAMMMIELELGNSENAAEYVEQYKRFLPNDPDLGFYEGYLAEKQERYSDALKHYANILEGKKHFAAQLQIAMVLAKLDKIMEARQHLLFVKPANVHENIQLTITEANVLSIGQMYQEAFDIVSGAVDKYGPNLDLIYARGVTAEKLDKLDIMEQDFKTILTERPMDADVLNALGYTLINQTNRYEEGLKYISKALHIAPNDPSVIDSMGWAYYLSGQLKKAVKYLTRAYSLSSQDSEIAAHLGQALWAAGEKIQAVKVWRSAHQNNPNNQYLNETIKKYSVALEIN